jgi:Tfp pilus assembly protein PilV
MAAHHLSAARRVQSRGRFAACLEAQRGDTLIEVMVAALLVALIATASLTGYGAVGHASGTQRNEGQAATLAQQDQARLRGLTITQLSGSSGNQQVTTAIDGTTYQVTSKSQFISGSNGAASCTTGGTASADEVQTTSTVKWGANFANGGRAAVVLHGVITPSQGGSLIISATDQTGAGLAGVTATVTGPTTVSPLTTDSSGCAIFAGLAGGSYTVTYSAPGYVDKYGNAPASWSGPVTSTQTATATPLVLAQDGAISATFTTFYNGLSHAATSDTFIASNTQMPSPSFAIFGTDSTATNNTYASTIASSTTLFPFAGTNNGYSVYAGGCQAEPPPAGQVQTATVQPTATTAVVLPLPAMIVNVWAGATFTTYDDPVSAPLSYTGTWTHSTGVSGDYLNTESTSATTNSAVTMSFTGTGVSWITVKGPAQGIANVSLDGGAASPYDTYKSTTQRQFAMYTVSGLTNGPHTLSITVTGTKNASSTGKTITIDSFIVQNAVALETIKPNVTVTETDTGCGSNKDYPPTQIPTATQGALASPGEPYGNYTVCADDGVNHNTATVANTNFAAGNVVNIYLGSGSAGLAGGTCP